MDFWTFVEQNLNVDPALLRLRYRSSTVGGGNVPGFDIELAITQIECRRRFGKKLSDTLARYGHWLFPSALAGEQATSDLLARYHASLVPIDATVVDLTSGLGIDALHISRMAASVIACDIEPTKTDALTHNVKEYSLTNITPVTADCRDLLQSLSVSIDCAFIDPARRSNDGSRVYALAQCQPDVTAMLTLLRAKTKRLIVKMSPMLDVTQTLRELPEATSISAIGTQTECKELIAIVDFDLAKNHAQSKGDVRVSAVTLLPDGSISEFCRSYSQGQAGASIGMPRVGDTLYEPYPAVMKTAAFGLLTQRYAVRQLHNNTHLFLSQAPVEAFPGFAFKIIDIIPFSSKHIKRLSKTYPRISVATRNFPLMTADKLRTKLGVADSDVHRLFATTLSDGSLSMIIASKI